MKGGEPLKMLSMDDLDRALHELRAGAVELYPEDVDAALRYHWSGCGGEQMWPVEEDETEVKRAVARFKAK